MGGGVNGRRAAAAGAAFGPACALLSPPLRSRGAAAALPPVVDPRRPAARSGRRRRRNWSGPELRKRCEKPCPRPPGCRRGPPVPPPFTRAGRALPGRPRPLRAARLATRTVRGRRPARGLALEAGRGRPPGPWGGLRCSLAGGGPCGCRGGGRRGRGPGGGPRRSRQVRKPFFWEGGRSRLGNGRPGPPPPPPPLRAELTFKKAQPLPASRKERGRGASASFSSREFGSAGGRGGCFVAFREGSGGRGSARPGLWRSRVSVGR